MSAFETPFILAKEKYITSFSNKGLSVFKADRKGKLQPASGVHIRVYKSDGNTPAEVTDLNGSALDAENIFTNSLGKAYFRLLEQQKGLYRVFASDGLAGVLDDYRIYGGRDGLGAFGSSLNSRAITSSEFRWHNRVLLGLGRKIYNETTSSNLEVTDILGEGVFDKAIVARSTVSLGDTLTPYSSYTSDSFYAKTTLSGDLSGLASISPTQGRVYRALNHTGTDGIVTHWQYQQSPAYNSPLVIPHTTGHFRLITESFLIPEVFGPEENTSLKSVALAVSEASCEKIVFGKSKTYQVSEPIVFSNCGKLVFEGCSGTVIEFVGEGSFIFEGGSPAFREIEFKSASTSSTPVYFKGCSEVHFERCSFKGGSFGVVSANSLKESFTLQDCWVEDIQNNFLNISFANLKNSKLIISNIYFKECNSNSRNLIVVKNVPENPKVSNNLFEDCSSGSALIYLENFSEVAPFNNGRYGCSGDLFRVSPSVRNGFDRNKAPVFKLEENFCFGSSDTYPLLRLRKGFFEGCDFHLFRNGIYGQGRLLTAEPEDSPVSTINIFNNYFKPSDGKYPVRLTTENGKVIDNVVLNNNIHDHSFTSQLALYFTGCNTVSISDSFYYCGSKFVSIEDLQKTLHIIGNYFYDCNSEVQPYVDTSAVLLTFNSPKDVYIYGNRMRRSLSDRTVGYIVTSNNSFPYITDYNNEIDTYGIDVCPTFLNRKTITEFELANTALIESSITDTFTESIELIKVKLKPTSTNPEGKEYHYCPIGTFSFLGDTYQYQYCKLPYESTTTSGEEIRPTLELNNYSRALYQEILDDLWLAAEVTKYKVPLEVLVSGKDFAQTRTWYVRQISSSSPMFNIELSDLKDGPKGMFPPRRYTRKLWPSVNKR